MRRKFILSAVSALMISAFTFAQEGNNSVKFNLGTSFSKPGDELATVAMDGKNMQLSVSAEAARFLSYKKDSKLGFRIAAVVGYDNTHILSDDAITQIKTSIPNIKGRIYPLCFKGSAFDFAGLVTKEKDLGIGFLDIPVYLILISTVNSLHFDYGVGFGKLKESSNIYDDSFVETTTNRTMNYFGWGFQPVIYNSESGKWSVNAMFDFGKFKWTNGNGNTSSFKMSTVGFGAQYHF